MDAHGKNESKMADRPKHSQEEVIKVSAVIKYPAISIYIPIFFFLCKKGEKIMHFSLLVDNFLRLKSNLSQIPTLTLVAVHILLILFLFYGCYIYVSVYHNVITLFLCV